VKIAGCAKTITSAVAGTTRSDAYFTENWKTFPSVSFSFCALSLEKAGKSMVVIGVAKNVINTAKFRATE